MSDRTSIPRASMPEAPLPTAHGSDEERKRALARMIEAEIVPRLLMSVAPSSRVAEALAQSEYVAVPDDLPEFTRLLLAHDGTVASAFVQILRERGKPDELICLQLLAPAARRMGVLWEHGACDSAELTLGLVRLHALLQEISGTL